MNMIVGDNKLSVEHTLVNNKRISQILKCSSLLFFPEPWIRIEKYAIYGNMEIAEAVIRGVLWKKMFLEISQNSLENICARVTHKILFPQISSVKNFSVAARVKNKTSHWRCKSSVKSVYPIRETAWKLLLS